MFIYIILFAGIKGSVTKGQEMQFKLVLFEIGFQNILSRTDIASVVSSKVGVVNARVILERRLCLTHYFTLWANVGLVFLVVKIKCVQVGVGFVAGVTPVHFFWTFAHGRLVKRQRIAGLKVFFTEMTHIGVTLVRSFLVSV